MRKNVGDYTSGGTGRSLEVFGVDVCNAKNQHSFLQLSPSPPHLRPLSPPLHQSLHLLHFALEEAVDFHRTAVSVKGDGGEAGERKEMQKNVPLQQAGNDTLYIVYYHLLFFSGFSASSFCLVNFYCITIFFTSSQVLALDFFTVVSSSPILGFESTVISAFCVFMISRIV